MNRKPTNRVAGIRRPSPEYPRRYTPRRLDFSSWDKLEPLFKELVDRPLRSVRDLEQLLIDDSELSAVVSEEGSRRYIAMTCATGDKRAEKAYLHFVENLEPKMKPYGFQLSRKLLDSPFSRELDPERYEVLLRSARTVVELFREENIPLETEVDKLSQQYQKIMGGMTVMFRGQEYTLQQMGVFAQSPDRDTRREAFEASVMRRLQEAQRLDDLFDRMLKLRVQIAKNAGFDNFRDYQFRRYNRFDYTPEDCLRFHQAVEALVVPLTRQSLEERRISLKLDTVRPWDTACDRFGRPALRPFRTGRQLAEGCRRIFGRVDRRLGRQFEQMMVLGLLDLESRKGKAPGGYQSSLSEVRLPFIFMNAVGLNHDVFTLLHEGGHAFHQFAVRDEPLLAYRHAPTEFSEVASMSMEKLGAPHLEVFYSPGDAARARRDALEGDVNIMPWIAIVDAFQHWIYTHPNHTAAERADYFQTLSERFRAGVDWTGYEDALRTRWQAQLHIFEFPFYYIEYGIALLGALQVWLNSKRDLRGAVDAYLNGLSLGGSRPLPELFQAAGLRFDFRADTIAPLMAEVAEEMERQGRAETK